MRLHIRHETTYAYKRAATRAVEILRLTPGTHDAQFVVDWRIDIDHDCVLHAGRDPFGNKVHNFTAEGPLESLTISAEGTVETSDTGGVLTGAKEPFPPAVYLRETPLTTADATLRRTAEVLAGEENDRIKLLHRLMDAIRNRMDFQVDQTDTGTSAIDAYALGHGVCQDFSHVFLAMARHVNIPARYVGGYLLNGDDTDVQSAGHAWAEALVEDLGWVGFDPANSISPTDAYVRVATGLDYLGAAPIRGIRYGGEGEQLTVRVAVDKAIR